MKRNILVVTNPQKVLYFLLEHPVRDFVESEIQKAISISKSGMNYALRDLVTAGFVSREKRGKSYFYTLNHKAPVIKQLKVLKTVTQIESLLKKLRGFSSRIILFGSSSRGEDISDSDIDLFIVSQSKERIEEAIKKFKSRRKIQAVVRSSLRFAETKRTAPIFYKQISQGIVLWESESESRI